jgi:isopentenyl-diphosphate delta-isomerase
LSSKENTATALRDSLILVDERDNTIGSCEKVDCHLGDGLLHRAFSVFLFNPAGQLLIQRRSQHKMLWPLYWANSCCSHPRTGEDTDDAAHRRIYEELGVKAELRYLYKFVYQAKYENVGSEYENCWVYFGEFDGKLSIDSNEIADYRFVTPAELSTELDANPAIYSPWLKLEWATICERFAHELPSSS